jgi:hypothetical protein
VTALVALGQGAGLDPAVERTLAALAGHPEIQVAALESSLAPGLAIPEDVHPIRAVYPMSRYYRAFDLAISAAGYNAFHELIAGGVPSLFVPMPRQLDDQAARASWARETGVGEGVEGPLDPELETRLDRVLDAGRREEIRERIERLGIENGAAKAAEAIEALMNGQVSSSPRIAGESRHAVPGPHAQKTHRWDRLAVSAQLIRRVGLRLPAIVVRRAVERFRTPPPPAAKLIAPALGLNGDELLGALHALSERTRVEPARILAITDSLDFAALRRAGFGFEYVPDEERAAPVLEATKESYERFAQRRIDEAVALRHRAKIEPLQR